MTSESISEQIAELELKLKEHGECDADRIKCQYDELWFCQISGEINDKLRALKEKKEGYVLAKKEDIEIMNDFKQTINLMHRMNIGEWCDGWNEALTEVDYKLKKIISAISAKTEPSL